MNNMDFNPELLGEETPVEGGMYNRGHHFRASYGDTYVYLKDVDTDASEFDTDREGLLMREMYANMASGIVLDDLDVNVPDMVYDEEGERLVIEEVGLDAQPVVNVDPHELYLDAFDTERYIDAVVSKMLVGDSDIDGNILVDATGEFYVIDFDCAGERRFAFEDYTYDEMVGKVRFWADNDIDTSVEEDTVRERSERLVSRLDVATVSEELERLTEFRGRENMLQNVEWFHGTFGR